MRVVTLGLVAIIAGCSGDAALDDTPSEVEFPDPLLSVALDEEESDPGLYRLLEGAPFRGRGSYDVVLPGNEGELKLRFYRTVSEPDYSFELTLGQATDISPVGTRYLDVVSVTSAEDAFGAAEIVLHTPRGQRYRGKRVGPNTLELDALTGSFRASLRLGIGSSPDILQFEVEGYVRVYCRHYDRRVAQLRPNWVDPYEPEDCAEVFDTIRATPDDPDAPAPPYVLYPE